MRTRPAASAATAAAARRRSAIPVRDANAKKVLGVEHPVATLAKRAYAGAEGQPVAIPAANRGEDAVPMQVRRQGGALIFEKPEGPMRLDGVGEVDADVTPAAYKYGDVAFLIGGLDDDWTKKEWDRYFEIAKWLVKKDFRVIMNPYANIADVSATAQDPRTKVMIWSSHANKQGEVFDVDHAKLPEDVFNTGAGKNLRQVIFSACYGDQVSARYETPSVVKEIYWNGTTTSDDLFSYLLSERFDPTKFGVNED